MGLLLRLQNPQGRVILCFRAMTSNKPCLQPVQEVQEEEGEKKEEGQQVVITITTTTIDILLEAAVEVQQRP